MFRINNNAKMTELRHYKDGFMQRHTSTAQKDSNQPRHLFFLGSRADSSMHRLDRQRSVTSLGTGQGRHSQAKHARELRKDMGRDHKPEQSREGEDKGGTWSNFLI